MIDQGTCSVCRFDADEPEREPQIFRRIKLNVDMSPDDFVTTQVLLPVPRCSATPVRGLDRAVSTNVCPTPTGILSQQGWHTHPDVRGAPQGRAADWRPSDAPVWLWRYLSCLHMRMFDEIVCHQWQHSLVVTSVSHI